MDHCVIVASLLTTIIGLFMPSYYKYEIQLLPLGASASDSLGELGTAPVAKFVVEEYRRAMVYGHPFEMNLNRDSKSLDTILNLTKYVESSVTASGGEITSFDVFTQVDCSTAEHLYQILYENHLFRENEKGNIPILCGRDNVTQASNITHGWSEELKEIISVGLEV